MIPDRRRDYLLELLRHRKVLGINELTELLDVSHMTVRRDISQLEEQGLVLSVSGGVRLAARDRYEPSWDEKIVARQAEKVAIARQAVRDIHDGLTIYLDAGTTTYEMARLLSEYQDLTVITNNFHIASLLVRQPHIALFHTGGRINHENFSAVGPSVVEFLRQVNVDIAFVSSSSWHAVRGLTTPDESKIGVKQTLLDIASKSVLVADSSKYGRFGMFRACALEDFDRIVTDAHLDAADLALLHEREIAVDAVPVTTPQPVEG
ncbi:DeoR/GlpR family DNA-binding transcription regulator [Salinisphaera sp. SPP-AMP-43]|uniref:DeoR/GlpR family DNA-binding transcription regulator n=1 Tax=Salinisphaera sp. SPP-AMP-43 TaxID=3121288 RepID=UPI003C6E87D6